MCRIKVLSVNSVSSLIFTAVTNDQSDRSSVFQRYSCVDSSNDDKFMQVNPGYPAYSRVNCLLADKHKQAVDWLNCSLIYYPPVPGTRFCSPMETTNMFVNSRYCSFFTILLTVYSKKEVPGKAGLRICSFVLLLFCSCHSFKKSNRREKTLL